MLALPTCSSEDKINYFLDNIKEEISKLGDSDYDISILVYINGKGAKEKKEEILFKGNAEIIVIADDKCIGKNDAMNNMVKYMRKQKVDIVHFFDDDVILAPGSLKLNIDTLVRETSDGNKKLIVGSNFYGRVDNSLSRGKRFLQWIFTAPYSKESDYNYFIAGYGNCCWLSEYPELPSTKSNVAEDSFVAIYFGKIGGGLRGIIKPEGSEAYFDVPKHYGEWCWQQIRTFIGIDKSFLCFGNEYDYYQKMFAWRYAEIPKYRKKYRKLPIKEMFRLCVFRIFQLPVRVKAKKYASKEEVMPWNKYLEKHRNEGGK